MRTRIAMDALRPAARQALEGVRVGSYVRLRFNGKLWAYTYGCGSFIL
jgi:hypothetical protein